MARRDEETGLGAARVLDADEVQGVLSGAFYTSEMPEPRSRPSRPESKPSHYKVICISLYTPVMRRPKPSRPTTRSSASRSTRKTSTAWTPWSTS